MKKKLVISILAILVIFVCLSGFKKISYSNDLKQDMDRFILAFDFVESYDLDGYLNSQVQLTVNNKFNDLDFMNKKEKFRLIYDELDSKVIEKAVKNKINLDTSKLVESTIVCAKWDNNIYSYKLNELKINKVDEKKPLGTKTLSDDQIVIKIQEKIKENSYVEELKMDIEPGFIYNHGPYNQGICLTMKNNFFDKKISEQYLIISEIFENHLETLRNYGVEPYYNYIYIIKKGNDYTTYKITEDYFELISLDKEINRFQIEENISLLDSYDIKKVLDGTSGGKVSSSPVNIKPTEDEIAFAVAVAQREVKNRLKAPSTAKFPWGFDEYYITKWSDGKFEVSSYVDAENAFGAMLRTDYTIKFQKTGEDSYKLIKVYIFD